MLKLKLDDEGKPVLKDGKPLYVKEDGSEFAADVPSMYDKITTLTNENRDRREKLEAAEQKLTAFGDVDPEKAREALEKLNGKELVDAGRLDELRNQLSSQYEEKLNGEKSAREKAEQTLRQVQISNAFKGSKFISDELVIPPDMVEATFAKYFKVGENGEVQAYNGEQPIMSDDRIGEAASFDEAMKKLVGSYAYKDRIMKATSANGSGARGAQDQDGKRTIKNSEFLNLAPNDQAKAVQDIRKGELVKVDDG